MYHHCCLKYNLLVKIFHFSKMFPFPIWRHRLWLSYYKNHSTQVYLVWRPHCCTRLKSKKSAIYWSCTYFLFPINMILAIWGTIHETTGTHTLIISNLFSPIFRTLTLILYVLVLQTDQSIAYSYSTCFRFLFYIGLKALHLPIINMHYIIRRGGKVFIFAFLISFFSYIRIEK